MVNPVSRALARWLPLLSFKGSQDYWRKRYLLGGDSGAGSSGRAAAYKAVALNEFVAKHRIASVIEFGCGDGRQLEQAQYSEYVGVDISPDAVRMCRRRFANDAGKKFLVLDDYHAETADLAMSIDVIFHLVEDAIYQDYLQRLFAAGERFVVLYSSDEAAGASTMKHVRHRNVSAHVSERFPDFERMGDDESMLSPPVERNRGVATRFLFYRRISAG